MGGPGVPTIEEKVALGKGVRDVSLPALPRRFQIWRSPADQPRFARPALLATAAVAAVAYALGANGAFLEPFYGAAARSMSASWHDFLFGAFDPAGTVTVDKLPGALWMQALSLRVLGFHVWALVLPQIVEGVLTILVLYRAVRRLAGPVAGIAAAVILAASPVTVALSRGNVSDSLLILLTVLAADAASAALLSGRLRSLLLAGVWVGLAFQAKMVQAWLVLPALAGAYLLAAPGSLRLRFGHVLLAGAVTVVVSLSWMSAVSLVPADERPYVDGSRNDSLFSQVFDYNGIARLSGGQSLLAAGPPAPFLVKQSELGEIGNLTARIGPSWHRLLTGPLGRDDGWLLPAALIGAAATLRGRRRAGRRDPLRAAVVLWGTWLLLLGAAFSAGRYLNSYYVAALSPATAALCGVGVELFWRERGRRAARVALAAGVLSSALYGAHLLRGASHVPVWLAPLALCLGVAGALTALFAVRLRGEPRSAGRATAMVIACGLSLMAVTSALDVARGLGPFDAPYQPLSSSESRFSPQQYAISLQRFVAYYLKRYRTPIALSTDTSFLAAPFIYYTGKEILPIGGFAGGVPAPRLTRLQHDVAAGDVRAFLIAIEPSSHDQRIVWIRTHCTLTTPAFRRKREVEFAVYDCAPAQPRLGATVTRARTRRSSGSSDRPRHRGGSDGVLLVRDRLRAVPTTPCRGRRARCAR
jgi:4-amino-4-deoxy-L-arabinose transferase-like glycosyltransferase